MKNFMYNVGMILRNVVLTILAGILYWPLVIAVNLITLPAQIVLLCITKKRREKELNRFYRDGDTCYDLAKRVANETDDTLVAFMEDLAADIAENTNEDCEPSVIYCALQNLVVKYCDLFTLIWEW